MKWIIFMTALGGCTMAPNLAHLHEVRDAMEYQTDYEQYGISDLWQLGCPAYGDCEDMGLCMIEKLASAGEDITQTKLWVCWNEDLEPHAMVEHQGWFYDPVFNKASQQPMCLPLKGYTYQEAITERVEL